VLIALAIIAMLTFVLPAVAATPSPMKVAKRALKIGKRADKRARKAQKAATRAMKAAHEPGARGATGPAGLQGTQGAPGANGTTGETGSQGATGVTGTTGGNGVSHAYSASSSTSVPLSFPTELTVVTLSGVPAGKYVLQAKTRIINNDTVNINSASCKLYDGATEVDTSPTLTLDRNGGGASTGFIPLLAARDKTATGDITLKCLGPTGTEAEHADLVAIAVDQLN
jgi:hypothetical protein